MGPVPALLRNWTRRTLLSGLLPVGFASLSLSGLSAEVEKGKVFGSDWRRFSDPATEFEVYRLTDPSYSSYLPAYEARVISRRNNLLLFCSDRTGSPQAFGMDLHSGESRQLTDAEALDGSSLSLAPDDRTFFFFDGPSLRQVNLTNLRQREIYRIPQDWQRCPGVNITGDGASAVFGEAKGSRSLLRTVSIAKGGSATVAEVPWSISHPISRPKRSQILYRQGNKALWLVNSDGQQNRRLKLAGGEIGPSRWSPDGRTVLYLNFPEDKTQLNTIREHIPDENLDKLVARTSQFVDFSFNANTSVFVGASRNRSSPHILILLRLTRRELTLCEHSASDPTAVDPLFSSDSQSVFFQSDKHGKPAIYRVRVEKFVERTEAET